MTPAAQASRALLFPSACVDTHNMPWATAMIIANFDGVQIPQLRPLVGLLRSKKPNSFSIDLGANKKLRLKEARGSCDPPRDTDQTGCVTCILCV